MSDKEKKQWIENGLLVRKTDENVFDHSDTERFYIQNYLGKTITIIMVSNEKPYKGVLVEAGMYVIVLLIDGNHVIVYKNAIEAIILETEKIESNRYKPETIEQYGYRVITLKNDAPVIEKIKGD